ncbi:MAG TPA: hypothetical protein ENJ00_05655 [Phycisphaerales bacterium]|nr:hypothetical protein [Phycisphaerales bacterium]
MVAWSIQRWLLPICLVGSLAVHLVAVALVVSPVSSSVSVIPADRRISPTQRRIRLGIEDGASTSIAWIGFQTETPHAAPEAETLQPKLSPEAAAAAAMATATASQGMTELAQSAGTIIAEQSDRLSALSASLVRLNAKASDSKRRADQQDMPTQPRSSPAKPNPEAIRDDRESDASSPTPSIRRNELGKVIARSGLRIRTFRPQFNDTTKQAELRSRHGRMMLDIRFGRDGRVLTAQIRPNTETGLPSIDEPILDSVFRWTATGEDLEKIPERSPPAGILVSIEVIF